MRTKYWLTTSLVACGLASTLAAGRAEAQYRPSYERTDDDDERTRERMVLRDIGLGASIGGGVTGFADGDVNDLVSTGGSWTARVTIGTRQTLAVEAAYLGTAQGMDALGLDDDAVLVSNGIEGALRLNLTTTELQPYVFGGAAWRHYSVTNEDFNTSNINGSDDVLEIPFGVGVAWRWKKLLVDGRFDYRPAFDDDLVRPVATADIDDDDDDNDFGLENWNVTARVGFEF